VFSYPKYFGKVINNFSTGYQQVINEKISAAIFPTLRRKILLFFSPVFFRNKKKMEPFPFFFTKDRGKKTALIGLIF